MRMFVLWMSFFALISFLYEKPGLSETLSASDELAGEYNEIGFDDMGVEYAIVKDPMEPYNRKIFNFNDKVYYYVIKPSNKGYNTVVPEPVRISVKKLFRNILMPGRFLNCLFQLKFQGAGIELARFIVNSSVGIAGIFDPAKAWLNLREQDEDFGQTLAKYKMKNGSFITWPFIGPSTVRDSIGFVGDIAMNPLTIVSLFVTPFASLGNPYDTFNDFSIDEGKLYESVIEASIDPYIAIQDAYIQNRNKKIEE